MNTRITRIAPIALASVLALGLGACESADTDGTDLDTGTTDTTDTGTTDTGTTAPLDGATTEPAG